MLDIGWTLDGTKGGRGGLLMLVWLPHIMMSGFQEREPWGAYITIHGLVFVLVRDSSTDLLG